MTEPSSATGWHAVSASVRGSAHVRNGLGNQDAAQILPLSGKGAQIVVAVADGHGSRDSFRSDVGAVMASDHGAWLGLQFLAAGPLDDGFDTLEVLAPHLATAIVVAWCSSVEEHLSAHPVTDAELVNSPRGRAGHEADPLRAYGTTLLLAVLAEHRGLLVQVGDGDILVIGQDGIAESPVPGDERLVAGETTSMCLPHAEQYARWVAYDFAPMSTTAVVLATDGYGNAFAEPSWRAEVGRDLSSHIDQRGIAWVGEQLETWLADSAEVGGDDVTLAIATQSGAPDAR